MNSVYLEADVAEQHRLELVCEAEHARLVQQVRSSRQRVCWQSQALVRLGDLLVAWGWWLRARYGAVEQAGNT